MKKYILNVLAAGVLVAIGAPAVAQSENAATMSPWYAYIGTGYAWTSNAGISNPDPSIWDAASEGYDSDLGHGGFYTIGFGRSINDYLRADLSYTNYATLHYQKYQTGQGSSIGSTGSARNRFFDLDSQSVLLNFVLQPATGTLTAHLGQVSLFPFVGVGLGVGFNRVVNFHTVASDGHVTTIADPKNNADFAWQGSLGITLHPDSSHLFMDIGYKYYDGGKFESQNLFTVNADNLLGVRVTAKQFEGKFKSNQAFVSLRYAF